MRAARQPPYGRYLKQTPAGLAIDRQAITAAERLDGKFVVHSNDDTLSAIDMALGYKQLQRVEEARSTGAELLVTACQHCRYNLTRWQAGSAMPVQDLVDLVYAAAGLE